MAAEIERLTAVRKHKGFQLASAKRRLAKLATAKAKAVELISAAERAFLEIRPMLIEVGFTEAQADRLRPVIPADALDPFEPIEVRTQQGVAALSGLPETPNATAKPVSTWTIGWTR